MQLIGPSGYNEPEITAYVRNTFYVPPVLASRDDISLFLSPINSKLLEEDSEEGRKLRSLLKIQAETFSKLIYRYRNEATVTASDIERYATILARIPFSEIEKKAKGLLPPGGPMHSFFSSGWPKINFHRYLLKNFRLLSLNAVPRSDEMSEVFKDNSHDLVMECSARWHVLKAYLAAKGSSTANQEER